MFENLRTIAFWSMRSSPQMVDKAPSPLSSKFLLSSKLGTWCHSRLRRVVIEFPHASFRKGYFFLISSLLIMLSDEIVFLSRILIDKLSVDHLIEVRPVIFSFSLYNFCNIYLYELLKPKVSLTSKDLGSYNPSQVGKQEKTNNILFIAIIQINELSFSINIKNS